MNVEKSRVVSTYSKEILSSWASHSGRARWSIHPSSCEVPEEGKQKLKELTSRSQGRTSEE